MAIAPPDTYWLWRTEDGETVTVEPTSLDPEFEWHPDQPGQRPPRAYRLSAPTWEDTLVVFPVEPWSPADALSDILVARGWTDLTPVDYTECVHGLSADLCFGPDHYGWDA